MDFSEFQQVVLQDTNLVLFDRLTLLREALGMVCEAGEAGDEVKKWIEGKKTELDHYAIIEEMGDALWYMTRLAAAIGYPLNTVAERAIQKAVVRSAGQSWRAVREGVVFPGEGS